MAESVELHRKTVVRLAGRGVGLRPEQPRSFQSQVYGLGRESDILAFPVQPAPGGIMTSSGLGFRFMLGVSVLGGSDPL